MVELVYAEQQITEQEYNTFERLFNRTLPDSFRKHYLAINGGFADENDMENGLWGLPIGGFVAIKYGKTPIEKSVEDIGDIVIPDENMIFNMWDYVPFAYDQGGNILFLSLKEESYDKVFIFSMDGMNIMELNYNFSAFIDKLYQCQ